MANEEQLSILKQGVDVWNKWREENISIVVNLRAAYLKGAKLLGAKLSGADLTEANIKEADLSASHLGKAILNRASLGLSQSQSG